MKAYCRVCFLLVSIIMLVELVVDVVYPLKDAGKWKKKILYENLLSRKSYCKTSKSGGQHAGTSS